MATSLDRNLSDVETSLAGIAADPGMNRSQRQAVRHCLGVIQGVRQMRRHALLRLVPGGLTGRTDCRARQLPTGDRDGGCDDAA